MKNTNNRIIEILMAVVSFVFNLDTLVTLLFLIGISTILYTIFSISLIAFGFTLGLTLIGLALLLNSIVSK